MQWWWWWWCWEVRTKNRPDFYKPRLSPFINTCPPFVRAPMSSQLQASVRAARTNLTYWEEPETPPPPPPAAPSVGSNVDEPIVSHSIVCCGRCFGGRGGGRLGAASLEMTDDDDNEEEVFYYEISKLCVCYIRCSVRKRWKSVRLRRESASLDASGSEILWY